MTHIGEVAKGNWKHLLITLGVDAKFLVNKHGPCPFCGGSDRFRWDNQNDRGGFFCSQCGGGDGFDLALKVTGKSFRQIADHIATIMGTTNQVGRKMVDPTEAKQLENMKRIWKASSAIADISPVAKYLRARLCGQPPVLQYVREVDGVFPNPAMVAKIISCDDRAINLHLTFLTRDGRKADISPVKRVMPGKLPDGCAIRLMPAAEVMGVAEGIETAISASLIYDMPVWACVNGALLAKWRPPEEAHEIVVFGDNDANYTGQAKAYELANRLEVQFKRKTRVMLPELSGTDWNDFHMAAGLTEVARGRR